MSTRHAMQAMGAGVTPSQEGIKETGDGDDQSSFGVVAAPLLVDVASMARSVVQSLCTALSRGTGRLSKGMSLLSVGLG